MRSRPSRSKSPQPRARTAEGFESFYKDTRSLLLLQTYALTGDVSAARRGVREAMVIASHHWRKVSRLEGPEDYVRPLAWSRARRHASTRGGRHHELDEDQRATFAALDKLSASQRTVLLLSHLAAVPIDALGREAGLSIAGTERELARASADFALHRGVSSESIRSHLEELSAALDAVRWPRPSRVSRDGSARRRLHTSVGVLAGILALLVSGSVVTDAAGARPALSTKPILESQPTGVARPASTPSPTPVDPLSADALLTQDQIGTAFTGTWRQGETDKNTAGDGLVFTCQASRYADSRGVGALVRTFTPTGTTNAKTAGKPNTVLTVGQAAEASADAAAAEKAYRTTVDWYAGCLVPRVQLLSTHRVQGVGDEATLLVLRNWATPATTQVVGVARTGGLTTTVVDTRQSRAAQSTDITPSTGLLVEAVRGLCALPDAGACVSTPQVRDSAPVPIGRHPSLLIGADLPPVPGVDQPWAGTTARRAKTNVAATRCDQTEFTGAAFTDARTRSYVIPAAGRLSPEFGLTETVGALPRVAAQQFIATIRTKLRACPDQDLGTDVSRLVDRRSGARDLTIWRLRIEVSERRSVRFLMAAIREGNAVAQLTFVPSAKADIGAATFRSLALRAQARLGELTTSG